MLKKRIYVKILTSLLVVIMLLSSCGNLGKKSDKIRIATTAHALNYFISQVGGERVDVVYSVQSNPHHFELTQADAKLVRDADIFMNINVGDYRKIGEQMEQSFKDKKTETKIVDLAERVPLLPTEYLHDEKNEHKKVEKEEKSKTKKDKKENETKKNDKEATEKNETNKNVTKQAITKREALLALDAPTSSSNGAEKMDAHIWLDPIRMQIVVENIAAVLIEQDPSNQTYYETNMKRMIDKLEVLDLAFEEQLAENAESYFIVTHGAYTYLADRYHLKQKSISSITGNDKDTKKAMEKIEKFIKDQAIKTIYIEDNIEANSVVTLLLEEDKLEAINLYNLETSITEADDYFDYMNKNLNALRKK